MKVEKFDHVHDVQSMYRSVLDSMSKPGRVNNISEELNRVDTYADIPKEIMGMAYLLLNTESSFYIQSDEKQSYIKLHTYARPVEWTEADYVFVDKSEISEEDMIKVVDEVKRGDLEDPHRGATIIIKTDELTEGQRYRITGPGIKGYHEMSLGGMTDDFVQARSRANYEYPMGVDMIVIDREGKLMALPRTTKIEVID